MSIIHFATPITEEVYYFAGFIGERMAVVFLHGIMTAIAVTSILKGGKGFLTGYAGAVLFHAFTNIGALLYQIQFLDATVASLYLFLPLAVGFFVFEQLHKKIAQSQKPAETIFFSRD
ncbi:hypothetical protein KEJ34_00190 [Candidatus Bathyarchaeota archaeon]|nr:hypothetical protein [Candidatus Bathyarchaeota archaeon]